MRNPLVYGRFENPGFYPPKFLGFSFFYRLEKMVVSPDLSFLKTGIQLVVIPGSLQRRQVSTEKEKPRRRRREVSRQLSPPSLPPPCQHIVIQAGSRASVYLCKGGRIYLYVYQGVYGDITLMIRYIISLHEHKQSCYKSRLRQNILFF